MFYVYFNIEHDIVHTTAFLNTSTHFMKNKKYLSDVFLENSAIVACSRNILKSGL